MSDNLVTIIYGLVESDTGLLRYVGKTTQPMQVRLKAHLKDRRKTLRASWIKGVLSRGASIQAVVLQRLPDGTDWQAAERRWIALYRQTGSRLVNGTAGGDGLHAPTAAVRAKCRLNRLGKKMPPEVVARHRLLMTGRKRTPEQRAKMSEAARKRGISAETRTKITASLRGRSLSEEHKRKIGVASKARPSTAAQLAALREAAKTQDRTAMVAKMTETKRRQAADPEWRARMAANFKGRGSS